MKNLKQVICVGVLMMCSATAPAQNLFDLLKAAENPPKAELVKDSVDVYKLADKRPSYPGGMAALMKLINEKAQSIPKELINGLDEKGSRVVVGFVIEKDGSCSNFRVVKGITPPLDNASLEAVKRVKMKKWKPAEVDGNPVRYAMAVAVNFKYATPKKYF